MMRSIIVFLLLLFIYPAHAGITVKYADHTLSKNLSTADFNPVTSPPSIEIKYADAVYKPALSSVNKTIPFLGNVNVRYSDLKYASELKEPTVNKIAPLGTVKIRYADINYPAMLKKPSANITTLQDRIIVKYADIASSYGLKEPSIFISLMEGDTNLNNHVTITDALLIAKYKAGLITLTPDQLKAADTSDDGSVTVTDALFIAKWLADPGFPLWDAVKDSDMLQPVP